MKESMHWVDTVGNKRQVFSTNFSHSTVHLRNPIFQLMEDITELLPVTLRFERMGQRLYMPRSQ